MAPTPPASGLAGGPGGYGGSIGWKDRLGLVALPAESSADDSTACGNLQPGLPSTDYPMDGKKPVNVII